MLDRIDARLRRTGVAREQLVDVAIVVLVAIIIVAELAEGDSARGSVTIGVAVAACIALIARRRHPLIVLGFAVGARIVLIVANDSGRMMLPIVAVALYTAARHGDRRLALLVASGAAAVMAVVAALAGDDGFIVELLEEGALAFLPIAIGDAVRTREERVNDLIEAEANARVQAERLRIARDLHDVVAHGLSAIAIQSGVAARLIDHDRDQARDALEAINATGRASLDDLRTLVGALRSTDVDPIHPTPSDPEDLTDVIATAEAAGVAVTSTTSGRFPDDVSDAIVVTVHRILQEALMNVARHAGAVGAAVRIDHADDAVRLSVSNEPAASDRASVPSTGIGIVGMRERAESVGGTLDARPASDGGFVVTAIVPYLRRQP